jgi:hypothetical protein
MKNLEAWINKMNETLNAEQFMYRGMSWDDLVKRLTTRFGFKREQWGNARVKDGFFITRENDTTSTIRHNTLKTFNPTLSNDEILSWVCRNFSR